LLCADDIIVTNSSPTVIDALLADLKQDFALKDLGPLNYFLAIKVKNTSDGILLTQDKYASDLLQWVGMMHCNLVATPLLASEKLSAHVGDPLRPDDTTKYRSIVGGLPYLSHNRPDLAFSINKVCQYLNAPTTIHWSAVKCIQGYMKHTSGIGLKNQKICFTYSHCIFRCGLGWLFQ
jgi:hypothetical protein